MGQLGRWLKDLLICRKHCANNGSSSSRHHNHSSSICTNGEEAAAIAIEEEERRDSRESWRYACSRSSIKRYQQAAAAAGSCRSPGRAVEDEDDFARILRSFRAGESSGAYGGKEQREHAVAVAEATAAAADAAMVAARAAVALVRLTSQGTTAAAGLEWRAAVKIQSAFRCHLAMKALKALRALVKMQAMVRGYLVRKQTARTFQSMQALMRAQSTMHSIRSPDLFLQQNTYPPPPSSAVMKRILIARYEKQMLDNNNNDSFDEMMDTSSPSISPGPSRLIRSTIQGHNDMLLADEFCQAVTTHNTPQRLSSACNATARNAVSNASAWGEGSKHSPTTERPNYMVGTESFNAKLRCQSTPKQTRQDHQESATVLVPRLENV